ncbi:unnamed protein product [Clonostachys chloroleuca]|uniref:Uncharacterized protein n=1 Tax=Clonostachys chloroleuca TaxID=1926264 RepID=A0AA35LPY7_9HYPO|nr:unnamed protein product [Clonostachys chloroleuca]
MNDYFSFKDEMIRGALNENMVYVIWYHESAFSFDKAVLELFRMICQCIQEYNAAAEVLQVKCGNNTRLRASVYGFVQSGRAMIMGWYKWQIESSRYELQSYVKDDGSMDIVF